MNSNTKHLLLACYSNGTTLFWHSTSKHILHRYEDSENPLNTLDINYDASKFATGGIKY